MITRQGVVLNSRLWNRISGDVLLLLLVVLLFHCALLQDGLAFLLRSTHLVLQLLDLPHLGVDQQVVGRLLLLGELHHREDAFPLPAGDRQVSVAEQGRSGGKQQLQWWLQGR